MVTVYENRRTPMNVSLTPELESFVNAKVRSGRYNSASEVVREALRLLEDQEQLRATRLAEFHAELDRRLMEADQGGLISSATLRKNLRGRAGAVKKTA
jgi:antitoxin ParD1/3/4